MFQPKFTITPEINTRIAEIERLRTLVDQAVILPELEVQLRFRATVEAVHSSTSIEGNPLNELQVQKLLHGKSITAPDYAIRVVLNYKKALDWLHSQEIMDKQFLSRDILDLHSLVMDRLLPAKKVGHFRSGDVFVIDQVGKREILRYTGPQASLVPQLVSSLLKWISVQEKSFLHPVLLAGLVHYMFVSIHPFSDGNGRSTRLITSYYLKKWGYDFRETLSLDTYYIQHQLGYYQSLSLGEDFDTRMEADLTTFLDFFTKGFLESAQNLTQYIQAGKVLDQNQKPMRLDYEELTVLDYTYQFGAITIQDAIDVLSLPKRTAQRRLMDLVEKGILKVDGQGPATRYILHPN